MDLKKIERLFDENFSAFGELGASVSVWRDGAEVVSLGAGWQDRERTRPWTDSTPALFWSATKGPASGCVLHACQEHRLSVDLAVCDLWPEFAAAGKETVTIRQVLSHQAGLPCLSHEVSVFDHEGVAAALAAQKPQWNPGDGHGYHPRTFGYLLDELVRRITGGTTIQEYWRRVFADRLGLELWIGMPAEKAKDAATMYAPRTGPPDGDAFQTAILTRGSLTARAFASPKGLRSASAMNSADARTASLAGFGGIGTASALARYYALLAAGGMLDGARIFSAQAMKLMTTTITQGYDRVLRMETAYSAGFMKDPVHSSGAKERTLFGPSRMAFGQPGAGGSHAFADPESGISFAYVMNQMEPGVLPNEKALRLMEALYV